MNTTVAGAKGQLGQIYAQYSQVIDRIARFVFGIVLFTGINHLTGYMKRLDSWIVVLVLALISAFLPTPFLTLFGFVLLLAHLASLSLPVMAVVAVLFLIMFALYFHFTPGHTIMLLLVPVAFWLKIPAVIPVAYGLMGSPAFAYPIACGCIAYYSIRYIHTYANTFEASGLAGTMSKISLWIRELFTNKEMWLYIFAFIICLWAVSLIRKRDMPHAWKLATLLGALIDVLLLTIGAAVLGVKLNIGSVLLGHVAAVIVGLILEYLFFGIDYKHKETIQFEDDDYVYYVSAVPKIKGDESSQREVKKLTHESASKKKDGDKNKSSKGKGQNKSKDKNRDKNKGKSKDKKTPPPAKKKQTKWENGMTDELLMTQSLRRDLEKEL